MSTSLQESVEKNVVHTTFIVLGASGDLAKKKTYPALFGLYRNKLLPEPLQIVGYARSNIQLDDFKKRISSKLKIESDQDKSTLKNFLEFCTYVKGDYENPEAYKNLSQKVEQLEADALKKSSKEDGQKCRIFYMALPPSVFAPAATGCQEHLYVKDGINRLVVEKPFGRDLDSSKELSKALASHWKEEEIYRIDHYLGKEMVKNLIILRFANMFFGAIWSRVHISNVQITFKEKIGVEGRGGYFDEFGIIRDVMQNHLLQILSLVAMEPPVSLSPEDIRDEKVKVLKCVPPLEIQDVLLGQFIGDGKNPGYLDEPDVPEDSNCPTFAAAILKIKNERWDGVPFILKCGKALNEQKAEIRIQFRDVPGSLFPTSARNELVIRVQPNEAVYVKMMTKQPGLSMSPIISELDLSYNKRYSDVRIPDAYEALILDILRGDHSNFVRDDELDAAWKIFTSLLHKIEKEKIQPEKYVFGSRGPSSLNDFISKSGFVRNEGYEWKSPL